MTVPTTSMRCSHKREHNSPNPSVLGCYLQLPPAAFLFHLWELNKWSFSFSVSIRLVTPAKTSSMFLPVCFSFCHCDDDVLRPTHERVFWNDREAPYYLGNNELFKSTKLPLNTLEEIARALGCGTEWWRFINSSHPMARLLMGPREQKLLIRWLL